MKAGEGIGSGVSTIKVCEVCIYGLIYTVSTKLTHFNSELPGRVTEKQDKCLGINLSIASHVGGLGWIPTSLAVGGEEKINSLLIYFCSPCSRMSYIRTHSRNSSP